MTKTATYWPPGAANLYGKIALDSPIKIKCRWQEKAELFKDAQGNQLVSSAIVYPNQVLSREGYLFLGESVSTSPRDVSGAFEIKQIGSSPSLNGSEELNTAWL
jgi:hypothetical protein